MKRWGKKIHNTILNMFSNVKNIFSLVLELFSPLKLLLPSLPLHEEDKHVLLRRLGKAGLFLMR